MTRVKQKHRPAVLGLAAVAALLTLTLAAGRTSAGPALLPGLVGYGPVSLTSMLACGYCLGMGAAMVFSDTWIAFLADMSSLGKLGLCAAACWTVVVSFT